MPRIKMIVYSILASLMLACCKEPTNTTPPPARKQLEVKWKTLLVPSANSTLRTIAMTPILYNGEVIFNSEYTLNGIEAPVVFLDTADGTIRRTWNDHSGGPYNRNTVAFSGIHLIFGEQRKVDCLNLLSASTAWKSSVNISYPMLHEHKGYLYRAIEFNPIGNQYNSCALMRTAVSSLAGIPSIHLPQQTIISPLLQVMAQAHWPMAMRWWYGRTGQLRLIQRKNEQTCLPTT
jgi:hypothetical protein